ncbi:hypothetical protein BIY37_10015 [Candidatus Brocadia sapporoensis]|uniref:HEPN AbiJ-N-terminal domain-containing protein n=1 Tax=Candidatus Brocadia sapporoensis TaxID=392547 RepID=A0A1V6LYC4_9BACT|nr:hypothetical protein [Candidatus Brocadia sapporoensis]MBE7549424.1 hypothetical protein [Planctomycetia bacterium]OQD45148.1 hypothetical protein BIY37_10015 [Candidatus Brocadia sapporoensis]GJQ22872.1 MAG: hypothetical protein HBSAPP01_06620 [Candidatus Brocadia sapporoensis]
MQNNPSFSERHGFQKEPKQITIRHEAPLRLRKAILDIAIEAGFKAKDIRDVLCRKLHEIENEDNWSDEPVMKECLDLIKGCEWFKVYEICEVLAQEKNIPLVWRNSFEKELNKFFIEEGIGWKLANGLVVTRGEKDFEKVMSVAKEQLEETKRMTAKSELGEAIKDLSRRPEPDITGAIQHSIAALECVARDISGEHKKTLGDIIGKIKIPQPIDKAIEKIWGFASNQARHIKEGTKPDFAEAELTVHLSAALISYLCEKNK